MSEPDSHVFDKPQREALAMLFLNLHYQEIVAAEFLWGLWLFPLAVLVYRSRFAAYLGVWLVFNGLAYVAASITASCGRSTRTWSSPRLPRPTREIGRRAEVSGCEVAEGECTGRLIPPHAGCCRRYCAD